jgi:hypothetical protein
MRAAALGGLLALALAAPGARGATLVVEGAGSGHGVGMSQDGALGYARHGASAGAILAHYYTGTTIGQAPPKATVRVLVGSKVVKLPLERYVRGVVAAEMPSSWPLAALEAQAIASRTYALTAHAGGSRFDVYSDTRSQVYLGVAAETAASNAAVKATEGDIVLYAGKPATTYFFASSGGVTENIEDSFLGSSPEPWLRGVPDPTKAARPRAGRSTSPSTPPPRTCVGSSKAPSAGSRCSRAASRRGSSRPACSARGERRRSPGRSSRARWGCRAPGPTSAYAPPVTCTASPTAAGAPPAPARRSPPLR